MSVKDINKSLIISDTLTGEIIQTLDYELYGSNTINAIIEDIYEEYIENQEHGIMIKIGYKNY